MPIQSIALNWEKYAKVLQARQVFVPAPTQSGLCYVEDGCLHAGACFFPADRLIVAEFLVTNPDIAMWERHRAVVELGRAFILHAAAAGKTPWAMVRHQGVGRALRRAGFITNGAVCFSGPV